MKKPIKKGIFNGLKFKILSVNDFCGFCEIEYVIEPNHYPSTKLFHPRMGERIPAFLKPYVDDFFKSVPENYIEYVNKLGKANSTPNTPERSKDVTH